MPKNSLPKNEKSGVPSSLISARSILRGDLGVIGLPTLLGMMELEHRSGILVLQHREELGRLHVSKGEILRARVETRKRKRGAEAVYEMLHWEEGQFELWHAAVDGPNEIGERTSYLLMEGLRRIDESHHAGESVSDGLEASLAGLSALGA